MNTRRKDGNIFNNDDDLVYANSNPPAKASKGDLLKLYYSRIPASYCLGGMIYNDQRELVDIITRKEWETREEFRKKIEERDKQQKPAPIINNSIFIPNELPEEIQQSYNIENLPVYPVYSEQDQLNQLSQVNNSESHEQPFSAEAFWNWANSRESFYNQDSSPNSLSLLFGDTNKGITLSNLSKPNIKKKKI